MACDGPDALGWVEGRRGGRCGRLSQTSHVAAPCPSSDTDRSEVSPADPHPRTCGGVRSRRLLRRPPNSQSQGGRLTSLMLGKVVAPAVALTKL
jgi:hypothetical protein